MKLLMAVLADGANVSETGKMNILGIFDRVRVGGFPAHLPDMVLAIRVGLEFEDGNKEHTLTVAVADEDGVSQGDIMVTTTVGEIEAGETRLLNQVVYLEDVGIEEAGQVSFSLLWNGERKGQVELKIEQDESEEGQAGRPSQG